MLDNTYPIDVLDHGKVELVDYMGSDLAIVQAAQSSFAKFSLEFNTRELAILSSLMREEHGVPFEHTTLKFRIDMPIFVARQLVKHRMSSWSEKSARYSEMEIVFYEPRLGQVRNNVGKPMAYNFGPADTNDAVEFLARLERMHNTAEENYEWAKGRISREQARFFLPVTLYTTITWTMNLRGFLNMVYLRNDDHAQQETREFAIAMEQLAATIFPNTFELFNQYDRKVP
jgi:thymidylate synthase (FAD)